MKKYFLVLVSVFGINNSANGDYWHERMQREEKERQHKEELHRQQVERQRINSQNLHEAEQAVFEAYNKKYSRNAPASASECHPPSQVTIPMRMDLLPRTTQKLN